MMTPVRDDASDGRFLLEVLVSECYTLFADFQHCVEGKSTFSVGLQRTGEAANRDWNGKGNMVLEHFW